MNKSKIVLHGSKYKNAYFYINDETKVTFDDEVTLFEYEINNDESDDVNRSNIDKSDDVNRSNIDKSDKL